VLKVLDLTLFALRKQLHRQIFDLTTCQLWFFMVSY